MFSCSSVRTAPLFLFLLFVLFLRTVPTVPVPGDPKTLTPGPRTRSVVGVRGPGVSVFGSPSCSCYSLFVLALFLLFLCSYVASAPSALLCSYCSYCSTVPLFFCSSVPLSLCSSVLLSPYSPVPLFPCSSVPLFLCSSVPLFLCSSVPLFLCSSVPLFLCSSVPLFLCSSVPLFLCSSVPLFLCSSVPLFLCSSVPLFLVSSVPLFLLSIATNDVGQEPPASVDVNSVSQTRRKRTWPISSHVDLTLGQKPTLEMCVPRRRVYNAMFAIPSSLFGRCSTWPAGVVTKKRFFRLSHRMKSCLCAEKSGKVWVDLFVA